MRSVPYCRCNVRTPLCFMQPPMRRWLNLQYAMLAAFLAKHSFAPPAQHGADAEAAMPAAAINECRAIVAGVMAACRRLTIAEGADAQELLNADFQQCAAEMFMSCHGRPIAELPQVRMPWCRRTAAQCCRSCEIRLVLDSCRLRARVIAKEVDLH